ncbi:hypothetical protein RM704_27150 [Streptomyces sp. DSM 3412]|uniref:Lipoprotein n=1 Tax=Streptomyces gottesmaniae TaxID=3075518 RepID=A0ABU2Z6Q0_9ACTN|nr:hypothetical protein [Streptomyces sp. DSM 3412]MDT0571097.1 hypothetical protein [Streptomyces sp. DSM 3412]
MSRAARGPHRALTTALALLSAAALLSTTACTSETGTGERQQGAEQRPTKAPAPPDPTSDSGSGSDWDEGDAPGQLADRAPDPVTDRVVLRQDRTRDSAHLEFGAARKGEGKGLTVAVSCEGKGTVKVVLRPMGASFPMECLDGEVTSVNNEFAVDGSTRAGTVSVTAAPGVLWSLSMGRGEPTPVD